MGLLPPSRNGSGFGFEVVLEHLLSAADRPVLEPSPAASDQPRKDKPLPGQPPLLLPSFLLPIKRICRGEVGVHQLDTLVLLLLNLCWWDSSWEGGSRLCCSCHCASTSWPSSDRPVESGQWSESEQAAWPGWGRAGSSCSVAINSLTSCLWFSYCFLAFQLEVGM